MAKPALRSAFERRGRSVELYREQSIEAIIDGKWLSGVIDRLHVFRDPLGMVEKVELLDFKTDAVSKAEQLSDRYAPQMAAYRETLAKAFGAPVSCRLLSTKLGMLIDC